ncbi:hypothetical protein IKE84_00050 [Candidatus Saccharibacteria bacterium]|nr:hypothetical protein [Candidatus Saccharibacteria bacterium]
MNNLSTKEAAAAGAIFGSMAVFMMIVSIAIAVFGIIAGWKIFKKAGQPGWKILIPIYNLYIAFKIVGMNFWGWFLSIFGCYLLAGIFGQMTFESINGSVTVTSMNPVGAIFYVAAGIISLVANIIFAIRLAHAFKKGGGFAVGIFFLPFIFELILAFGSAKYDKKAALKK